MSEGRTPPLQDPGGLHSYKTLSPTLQDTGGLHVYSLNGGAHKMAEIVPQSSVAMGMTSQAGSELGLYPGSPLSSSYQMDGSDMQNVPFIEVEPLSFNEQGRMYEELKRPSPPQVQYFGNLENIHNSNNMYNHSSNSFTSVADMFKSERDSLGGYVELLGNSESLMNIKREKPDYNEHMVMGSNQQQEMAYPPNTCVSDWNYYNSISNDSGFQDATSINQSQYGAFNVQAGPSYGGMVNNPQLLPQLQSNIDIHNQSKKITQNIIGTEWSQDNLFKSRLYSNFDVQSNGRKRKNDSERATNKSVKSRRKKSNELGGHSKTVASILMSDNTTNYIKSENTTIDSNILDSSERNELVTKLMNNLRTTVQFESFCLSFPRNDVKENAFRCKVLDTANLIDSLANKSICSAPFPASFVMGASKCLLNFNNALRNSRNKITNEEESSAVDSKNRSVEQVEEHLPHSMVWVIKTGDKSLMANWEGQFVGAVNPIQNVLSLTVFQYMPSFSGEGIKCLQQAKLSKDLANDILENMEQFEVSRQLRCDISLKDIAKLYLYKQNGDENEGCLIIEGKEKARFFQRWLHTSADDKNRWRERTNFLSKMCSGTNIFWIGGLVSELNELVAMMLASCPELEPIYKAGVNHPLEIYQGLSQMNGIDVEENGSENSDINKLTIYRSQRQRRPGRKLGSNVIKLRAEITEVLKSHIIIKANAANINSNAAEGKEESSADSLGIYLDENLCCCFRDYINFSCDSAVELNSILQQKVHPRNYGYYENDFDLSLVPDGNIDNISVGELISSRCSEVVYYSFCAKDIGQLGYERHCSACRKCRTMRFWHCYACDRCSESRLVCEFCGHLRDDQSRCVVKPLSVFKSQVAKGTLTLDNVKKEWLASLNCPLDDVITLAPLTLDMNITERMEYNSSNAMIDQLGLLNPVGFLLGQPTSGASRKHRRYKVGQSPDKLPHSKAGGSLTGSGCSVQ
ncbi:uncharacterized protein LOC132729317 isoform X2 [Ruditapes philippinarum]|nr:uncharacterized protein LOC132729317 isoform X2 [Ruditapes philippinarum]